MQHFYRSDQCMGKHGHKYSVEIVAWLLYSINLLQPISVPIYLT